MKTCIAKWAARDEAGEYRDSVIIGDIEPRFFMGRWNWEGSRQCYCVDPNSIDACVQPGQKMKVKLYITQFE